MDPTSLPLSIRTDTIPRRRAFIDRNVINRRCRVCEPYNVRVGAGPKTAYIMPQMGELQPEPPGVPFASTPVFAPDSQANHMDEP